MECKFKIGDEVIVTKKLEYYIYKYSRDKEMYNLISEKFIVIKIEKIYDLNKYRIYLSDTNNYVFEDCLELEDIKIKWVNQKKK